MAVFVAIILAAALLGLDRAHKLDLTHPAGVLAAALFFLLALVYATGWLMAAVMEALTEKAWVLTLLGAGCLAVLGFGLGLYVLLKANLRPRGTTPEERLRRLLCDGLALGAPLQLLLAGGYMGAALAMGTAMKGPWWMTPFYPLLLAALWPMMHLVFHTALVAWMLDPLILWCAGVIGLRWGAQWLFLANGSLRFSFLRKESAGKTVLRFLLACIPVANLISAVITLRKLRENREEALL